MTGEKVVDYTQLSCADGGSRMPTVERNISFADLVPDDSTSVNGQNNYEFESGQISLPNVKSCGTHGRRGSDEDDLSRIVGGEEDETQKDSWSFIVLLSFRKNLTDSSEFLGVCGGTIISDNWIVTTAQCCQDQIGGKT